MGRPAQSARVADRVIPSRPRGWARREARWRSHFLCPADPAGRRGAAPQSVLVVRLIRLLILGNVRAVRLTEVCFVIGRVSSPSVPGSGPSSVLCTRLVLSANVPLVPSAPGVRPRKGSSSAGVAFRLPADCRLVAVVGAGTVHGLAPPAASPFRADPGGGGRSGRARVLDVPRPSSCAGPAIPARRRPFGRAVISQVGT